MPIMIAPGTGEPRLIPEPEVKNYLRQGYRLQPPPVQPAKPALDPELETAIADLEAAITDTESGAPEPTGVNVNTASLKELTTIPQVTTAIARQVIAQRPYTTIDDLIAKVTGVEWSALATQLQF